MRDLVYGNWTTRIATLVAVACVGAPARCADCRGAIPAPHIGPLYSDRPQSACSRPRADRPRLLRGARLPAVARGADGAAGESSPPSLGGTITYADGCTLHANTNGLEPSTIPHGQFVFTVHDLHNTSQPKAPEWYAFTLVVFDQAQRVYPFELG